MAMLWHRNARQSGNLLSLYSETVQGLPPAINQPLSYPPGSDFDRYKMVRWQAKKGHTSSARGSPHRLRVRESAIAPQTSLSTFHLSGAVFGSLLLRTFISDTIVLSVDNRSVTFV